MTPSKIIMIAAITAIVLFATLIIYSLSPTISNVSEEPALKPYLNKPLILKTNCSIFLCKKGMYEFVDHVLTTEENIPGKPLLDLPVGAAIFILEFKMYTSNLGSGYTHLYALGEYQSKEGPKEKFEYDLGFVDKKLYSEEPYNLPLTVWQDSTDLPINFFKAKN